MSKLLLITADGSKDQLLLLVPDAYSEPDVLEAANNNGMVNVAIHELPLPGETTTSLQNMGMKEWRTYWG